MSTSRRLFIQGLAASTGALWLNPSLHRFSLLRTAGAFPIGLPPGFPAGFELILTELLQLYVLREIGDLARKEIPDLARKYELQFTDELRAAKTGGAFLSLPVTAVDDQKNTATLLVQLTDKTIPKLEQLKIGLARAELTVERSINLTDSSQPPIKVIKTPSYALELDFSKQDNYDIRLGYAHDENLDRAAEVSLAAITWKDPRVRFFGLLGKSEQGGILINVICESRSPFPIGSTGLGLRGIGLLYGEKFAPLLDPNKPQYPYPIKELESADARRYAEWASNATTLTTWVAVPDDLRMYGLSASIVDMATGGWAIQLKDAGIAYLSFGPTIIFSGELIVLDTWMAGRSIGVIDIRSKSVFGRNSVSLRLFDDALVLEGSAEFSASFSDQSRTYFAVGGYDMVGCVFRLSLGPLKDFLELRGGVRVVPTQAAAARASGRIAGEGTLCGFGGGYEFSFDIQGAVGWNPTAIQARLELGGSAWIKVLGIRLGMGVYRLLELLVSNPLFFRLQLIFVLKMPWGIKDKRYPITIFRYSDPVPANPSAPMKLAGIDALAFCHPPSGFVGELPKDQDKLWPDSMFILDFQRSPGSSNTIINPMSGQYREAGIDVRHNFSTLKIEVLDPSTGAYTLVPSVRASWLLNARNGLSERSSRLGIPCNNPLGWLYRFEHAQPDTAERVRRSRFQTFGTGPSKRYELTAGRAMATFEEVDIQSVDAFWLIQVPWTHRYGRAVSARRFAVTFNSYATGVKTPLRIARCELRLVGALARAPQLSISNGLADPPRLISAIGIHAAEWSVSVARSSAQDSLPLQCTGEMGSLLVAVAYEQVEEISKTVPNQSYLAPGFYRLTVNGESFANFRGTPAKRTAPWSYVRNFEVVPPPLRPYIRYATLGDERVFGVEFGGWNPNPAGCGFGHYPKHLAQIRSRVAYLSGIYPRLLISVADGGNDIDVPVLPCEQGTLAGAKASQEWRIETGQSPAVEEELTFDAPSASGTFTLSIYRTAEGATTRGDKIDEWQYRVATYDSPVDHLRPRNLLTRAFGPFGSRDLHSTAAPDLATDFDFDAIPTSLLADEVPLPLIIGSLPGLSDAQCALSFLRVLEWCGVFEADPPPIAARAFGRPRQPDLNVVCDSASAPVALLLRTGEPCDWRRVQVHLAYLAPSARRYDAKLIPSTDGCQCLIFLVSEGVAVRVPTGRLALRFRFLLEAAGLPRLTAKSDHKKTFDEVKCVVDQTVGQ